MHSVIRSKPTEQRDQTSSMLYLPPCVVPHNKTRVKWNSCAQYYSHTTKRRAKSSQERVVGKNNLYGTQDNKCKLVFVYIAHIVCTEQHPIFTLRVFLLKQLPTDRQTTIEHAMIIIVKRIHDTKQNETVSKISAETTHMLCIYYS